MKRKDRLIIILLSLIIIILGFSYAESQNARKDLQSSIDNTFKHQIGEVLSSFSMIVNDYTYRTMLSSVSNVASMAKLTSYEELNDDLDISLHNLYISLREEKSKDNVLSRIEELRDTFLIMLKDPASKKATNQIIQITNETFFNVAD